MSSVSDSECRSVYGQGLSSNVLCAEEVGGSVCNGDSGTSKKDA